MGEVSTTGLDIAKSVFQAHGVDPEPTKTRGHDLPLSPAMLTHLAKCEWERSTSWIIEIR